MLESMVSISLMAMAIVPALALLSYGLDTTRSGGQRLELAAILQQAAEEVKATSFDELANGATETPDFAGSGFTLTKTISDVDGMAETSCTGAGQVVVKKVDLALSSSNPGTGGVRIPAVSFLVYKHGV